MSDFRHVTNLRTPYDALDQKVLDALGQDSYRIGTPIEVEPDGTIVPVPHAELVENGIVGLYVTYEALMKPEVARKTGWGTPPLDIWNKLPIFTG